ncbi:MAG: hypothetical protein JWM28_657 [Chitinophagaceae bacterium]|nr:hypothetical protein [Chitinophagaceae bacterium]
MKRITYPVDSLTWIMHLKERKNFINLTVWIGQMDWYQNFYKL